MSCKDDFGLVSWHKDVSRPSDVSSIHLQGSLKVVTVSSKLDVSN